MEVDKDSLIKEGQEFINMREKEKRTGNPDAGTACYLISIKWIDSYKNYIHFEALKQRRNPTQESDHCKMNHPGRISNQDFLESDTQIFL